MQIREISFYKQFKCLGGDCPHTCCHGWMIPLTQEDCERFRKERGMLWFSLAAAQSRRDILCFNKGSDTCTFLDKNGLCSLQLKKGHDFIPEACRMFPRFYRNYGEFEERYIDPACIQAARLMLDNAGSMSLITSQGEPLSAPCTTNDDTGLLEYLVHARESVLKRLENITGAAQLNEALNDITGYSSMLQEAFLKGKAERLKDIPFTGFHAEKSLFPMDIGFFKAVMETSFYHMRLKRTNPLLYRLCRLYFDKYRTIMNSGSAFAEAANDFIKSSKEAVPMSTAYYAYYIYLYFLKSFEDYSFVRNASMGIIHTNMIFMFSMLLSLDEPGSFPVMLPDIISAYDRRACFNDEIMHELYTSYRHTTE